MTSPGAMRWFPRRRAERSLPLLVLALLLVAPLPFLNGSHAAPGDPKPDLVVASADITGWSQSTGHSLTATIQNTGGAPAPSSVLSITASDGSWNTAVDVPPIGANTQINVSTVAHTTFYGALTLTFLADGGATVEELDEDNNTFDLTRDLGRPDLRVVTHTGDDPDVRIGESASFYVTIENVGIAVASPVEIRATQDGVPVAMPLRWDPLHPGQNAKPSFSWTATKIGDTTFNITLDPDGRLPETNETNNDYTTTVPVLAPEPMHDLAVDTFTQYDGGTAMFHVEVKALGDHPPAAMRVRYTRGGVEQETREVSPPITVRESHDRYRVMQGVYWSHPSPDPDSPYSVQVTLDPGTPWESNVWYNGTGDGGTTCCWQDGGGDGGPAPPPTPGPTMDHHEDRFGMDDPAHIVRIDMPEVLETTPKPLPVAVLVKNVESPGPVSLRLRIVGPDGGIVLDHEFRDTTFTSPGQTKTAKTEWTPKTTGVHTFEATLIDHSRPVPPQGYTDRETVEVDVRLFPSGTPGPTAPADDRSDLATQSTETATGPSTRTIGIAAAGGLFTTALAGAWLWASEPRRYRFITKLLGLPGLLLFSRIKKDKVLDHATRERIHETIQGNPGIHFSGLRRLLHMPNGTLVHHLRTLEREGLLKNERVGGRLHFYAVGERARMAVGLTPRQDIILRSLVKRPGIAQAELARHLGVSRQALHQHLTPLRDLGLVADLPHGRTRRLYLDTTAPERLATCRACHATLVTDGGPALCSSCGDRLPAPDVRQPDTMSSTPYAASRTH
ncbi:MAG: winged helix-turn-helix transcriptional regulator [Euryarchaeota archaeon]|nr:winged helix-turn-helix transcriptional regulator [Euryarchaeota archaeon]